MANIALRRNPEPSLAPRSSFSPLFPSIGGRMDPFQWMGDFFHWDPFQAMVPTTRASAWAFSPDFEIEEMPDRYVIRGDLPGIPESDLNISVSGNQLIISGKREAAQQQQGANYYCCERSYGSFSRSFTLPVGADLDHVKADLNNGVLTLEVPRKAEVQPRKIALGGGESKGGKQARA